LFVCTLFNCLSNAKAQSANFPFCTIEPNLGQAYIIPYGKEAQFQIGWRGFYQLAMRTAQYKKINPC